MKKGKSYIKAVLSGLVWGLGQLFNKQYLKALFFFAIFSLFIGLELGTGNYFIKDSNDQEMAYSKITGTDFGDSWFEQMPDEYFGLLDGTSLSSTQKQLVQSDTFEAYLEEIGISVIQAGNRRIVQGREKFTEQKAIEFLARDLKEANPLTLTNLKNKVVLDKDNFNLEEYSYIVTKANLFIDNNENLFYESNVVDESNKNIKTYVQLNLFTRDLIDNPIVLPNAEGLVPFIKTGDIFKYNDDLYLKVTRGSGDDKVTKYIQINEENNLIYYEDEVNKLVENKVLGPLYMLDSTYYEYYQPALLHNGVRLQYKETNIFYTFKRKMEQTFNNPRNDFASVDVEKLMLKVHFELNPEIKSEYIKYYSNFFNDKAGIFIKGYWSVVTLGVAKKQNYTSYTALTKAMIGDVGTPNNLNSYVNLVENIPIQGHISTMLLIEGLIAVLLSLFFFIFMIWSVRDAYKISESKRKKEEVLSTKKYFKGVWDNGFEYIVLSPAVFVLAFISIMPILFGFIISFTSISGNQSMVENFNYVGLKNFFALFNFSSGLGASFGKSFWSVLIWTIIWAVFSTFTVFFGGFLQAMILNSERVVFRKLWRTILILPWAIPALLSQMVFSVMFKEAGFINQLLRDVGVYNILQKIGILGKPFSQMTGILKYFWVGERNIQWFSNSFNIPFVRTTLIVVNIWLGFPYFMALMTGVMTAIDKDLYEAASIDGASKFQQTMKITMPLVLYSTAPILIMTFSGNFNNFGVIYFITGGGPNSGLASRGFAGSTDILISWMYRLTVDYHVYNMASVFSVLVFLVVGSVTAWNLSKTRAFQGD